MIGWLWEVCLNLIMAGEFVNRGVLHGPWLPIYGTGGILILTFLNYFRKKPMMECWMIAVLCGSVEYLTAATLEWLHHGQKWWDYSGYFLNLQGRICAEGILVFSIGGMAIVYLVAPMVDNLLQRLSKKAALVICVALLVGFVADVAYSGGNPNTGKGITDYSVKVENRVMEGIFFSKSGILFLGI
ncbi:putative ABC transporter permease [Bariatricus sp. SGI.154]